MTRKIRKIIVHDGANATTDYYFSECSQEYEFVDFSQTPLVAVGDKFELIFIRYFSWRWRRWCSENSAAISAASIFIDDDVFDISAWRGLPSRYKFKLWNRCFRWRKWLQANDFKFLVSTEYLLRKYQYMEPKLVQPRPLPFSNEEPVVVFYHGSASHKEDIEFVYQVMADVLAKNPNICFEVFGNGNLNKKFKQLPRTAILHPMKWQVYKGFNRYSYRHIGLAPLVETPFNAARSCTKFYDISQAGAVGIYAKRGPYSAVVQNDVNGILVDMSCEQWSQAIQLLATDEARRSRLGQAALASLVIEHR